MGQCGARILRGTREFRERLQANSAPQTRYISRIAFSGKRGLRGSSRGIGTNRGGAENREKKDRESGMLFWQVMDETPDAIFQDRDVEVDEQAHRPVAKSQVR
jgi:hypothetical protein